MNEVVLDLAAEYANAYRAAVTRRHGEWNGDNENRLREYVAKHFGNVYASILCK